MDPPKPYTRFCMVSPQGSHSICPTLGIHSWGFLLTIAIMQEKQQQPYGNRLLRLEGFNMAEVVGEIVKFFLSFSIVPQYFFF